MPRIHLRWKMPFVVSSFLILACLLPPRIGPDRESSRYVGETAAIKAITKIHNMQVQYSSQYGRYATSLAELSDLIDSMLAAGEQSGYKFSMTTNQGGGYAVSAVPIFYGSSGRRAFYSDETLVIRINDGPELATAHSKEMK